jgi:hypothetical protein
MKMGEDICIRDKEIRKKLQDASEKDRLRNEEFNAKR